jgi:hypothetical protein
LLGPEAQTLLLKKNTTTEIIDISQAIKEQELGPSMSIIFTTDRQQ